MLIKQPQPEMKVCWNKKDTVNNKPLNDTKC